MHFYHSVFYTTHVKRRYLSVKYSILWTIKTKTMRLTLFNHRLPAKYKTINNSVCIPKHYQWYAYFTPERKTARGNYITKGRCYTSQYHLEFHGTHNCIYMYTEWMYGALFLPLQGSLIIWFITRGLVSEWHLGH